VEILHTGFETGQAEGWSLSGGAAIDSSLAIGHYSVELADDGASAVRTLSTAGYSGVSITMSLAGEGLQKTDECTAEVSTNGGSSWTPVVRVSDGTDTGSFRTATVSPSAASNNSSLRLRFLMTGKGNGDYCWGDEVIVRGT
jgi:hypothetical protein